MPAYVILVTEVTDEERHAEFRSRQPSLIEAKGGKVVMRGPVAEATDGETTAGRRIAVMEFPTVEQAQRLGRPTVRAGLRGAQGTP